MPRYANCVIEPEKFPQWQAPDGSREVTPLVSEDSCDATSCTAGMWSIRPGLECSPDIHPDADELYYVVSGSGILTLGDESFSVREGMTIFIPRNVTHVTRNTGDVDLTYFWVFTPPSQHAAKQQAEGWVSLPPSG